MKAGQDFEVVITRRCGQPNHFHPELELCFVIDGTVEMTVKDRSYQLEREDFLLVNQGVTHKLSSPSGALVCAIRFSAPLVARLSGQEINLFLCSSLEAYGPAHQELLGILREAVRNEARPPRKTEGLRLSILYRLLDCLIENFQVKALTDGAAQSDDEKLQRIYQHINQHYRDTVSMSELADELYMSKSTVSRFFRRETGIYFNDYVNQVRLKHALEDLLYTDSSMTKIAMDSGFSSSSAFTKAFREAYGQTPGEYRLDHLPQKEKEQELDEGIKAEIREKLSIEEDIADERAVALDAAKTTPLVKKWGDFLSIGSVYSLTNAKIQQQVLYLKNQLGLSCIRVWSVFTKKLRLSDGKTPGHYNYDRLDTALDFLVSNKLKPFLDFGHRPDTALYAPGTPVFIEEDYIPFASKEIWQDLFTSLVIHIAERYGEKEASGWRFEFSYDYVLATDRVYYPGSFSYEEAFSYASKTLQRYLPGVEAGGPMAEPAFSNDAVPSFLSNCQPGFLSLMIFPDHEDGLPGACRVSTEPEKNGLDLVRKVMDEAGTEAKLYITEWNNTTSNRDSLNDSCYRATYFLDRISKTYGLYDLMGLWMGSDLISSYYDTTGAANGGSGILTKDTLAKPAFYALQFLQSLGDQLIAMGPGYIATRNGAEDFHILVFNHQQLGSAAYAEKSKLTPRQVHRSISDGRTLKLTIVLSGMRGKSYAVKKRTMNEDNGAVLGEWRKLQYEERLSEKDLDYLRSRCCPLLTLEHSEAEDGKLTLLLSLQPQEFSLIHIYPDKP